MAEAQDTAALSDHQKMMLNIERDTAFMQSFLRVDLGQDSDPEDEPTSGKKSSEDVAGHPPPATDVVESTTQPSEKQHRDGDMTPRPPAKTSFSQLTRDMQLEKAPRRKRGRVKRQEESYTDKDRAAAVNLGSRDIKHHLKEKKRLDRNRTLQIPDEADSSTLLALGNHEMRSGNVDNAINFVHKALELNPNDKNALVARSKCYLLMGEPKLALQDAETALGYDKTFIRAIFQKAESLYHLGDFEHSLMYYHRGQRIRPELEGFRLGVQKAQEAIENTIGGKTLPCVIITKPPSPATARQAPVETNSAPDRKTVVSATSSSKRSESSQSRNRPENNGRRRSSNRLLGELCVDKVYLEQLLTHPDIKCGHQESSAEHILNYAQEGVAFLNNRQEFWRQQRSSTAAQKKAKKH